MSLALATVQIFLCVSFEVFDSNQNIILPTKTK